MASNLQRLRKAAGYRSASAFAEARGIAVPTYARYESSPDKIPLQSAWQLADALGCSIDEVVGRKLLDDADRRGDFQRFYDDLTCENRVLMDEFRAFVTMREQGARRRRRLEERRHYDALARQYELLMLQEREAQASFGDLVAFGTPEEQRAAFEGYVTARAAEKRAQEESDQGELEERDAAVLAEIMAAYDRAHPSSNLDLSIPSPTAAMEYNSGGGDAPDGE